MTIKIGLFMGQIVVWGVVLASELINEILIIDFTDCKTNHLIDKLCDSEKICVLFANFGDSVSTSLCSSRPTSCEHMPALLTT